MFPSTNIYPVSHSQIAEVIATSDSKHVFYWIIQNSFFNFYWQVKQALTRGVGREQVKQALTRGVGREQVKQALTRGVGREQVKQALTRGVGREQVKQALTRGVGREQVKQALTRGGWQRTSETSPHTGVGREQVKQALTRGLAENFVLLHMPYACIHHPFVYLQK